MFRFFNLLILVIVGFGFSGCSKKDGNISVLNGTYTGNFYYHVLLSSISPAGSGPVTVKFLGNNYTSNGNPNRMPAGGSGTYQTSDKSIQFKDINFWTADFDYGLVLNGNYTYETKGDSLILTKLTTNSYYEYRLKRTK